MTALAGTITLTDGSTVSVSVPDDGGIVLELRPFSSGGDLPPASAVMSIAHWRDLIGLGNDAIGIALAKHRERQATISTESAS